MSIFMAVHDRIGKNLMISMQDEGAICMKQMAGPQRYLRIKLTQTCIIIISGGIKFCVHPIPVYIINTTFY